jgi:flagellar hook-associated protein 3 FlgL
MSGRVTTSSTSALMLRDIQAAQWGLTKIQGQIASNKRIQIASDDPGAALASIGNRAELRRSQQLGRNADRATDWLNAADRASTAAVDILTQARGLVIQATSGASDNTARLAIANQIRQLRESLLSTANMQVGGRSIFAGTAAGAAYDAAGTFTGDTGSVSAPVAAGVTMRISRTGTEMFGTADPLDPANGDVFQVLDVIATAVQGNDATAVQAALGRIDTATTRVQNVQTELGSRLTQLEDLRTTAAVRAQDLSLQISELEDIDLAEATITLKAKELAYQSALGVAGRILQTTLLDFLR